MDLCIGFCCICEFWKHLRADCESMSLYQDASCGWLLMRFGSCDEHLQSRKGMMGVFHLASLRQSHALMIKQATQKIIQMFCSPGCTMPYSKVQRFLGIGIFLVQWMKNPRNRMLTHDIIYIYMLGSSGQLMRSWSPSFADAQSQLWLMLQLMSSLLLLLAFFCKGCHVIFVPRTSP